MAGTVLPEVVILDALRRGFYLLRRDGNRTLEQLFRDFDRFKRDEIIKWFNNNSVRLCWGWPDNLITFPVIAVRTMGDNESNPVLGDYLGNNIRPEFYSENDDDTFSPEYLGDGETWQTDPAMQEVECLGGMGIPNRPKWNKNDPANPLVEVGGGGTPVYARDTLVERYGAGCSANYLLQVFTGNAEETLVLSALVRAIIYGSKLFFTRNGMHNIVISRSDMPPVSNYFPTIAFSQGTTLQFDYNYEQLILGDSIVSIDFSEVASLNYVGDTPLPMEV